MHLNEWTKECIIWVLLLFSLPRGNLGLSLWKEHFEDRNPICRSSSPLIDMALEFGVRHSSLFTTIYVDRIDCSLGIERTSTPPKFANSLPPRNSISNDEENSKLLKEQCI